MARQLGATPRVALLSHSTFGNPPRERLEKIRDAVAILDRREDVDFEYEGEMNVDVALNPDMRELYPFSRLTGPANVLVMPAIHSASISTSLLASRWRRDGDRPGADRPRAADPDRAARARRCPDIVTFATLAAFQADETPKRAKLSGR